MEMEAIYMTIIVQVNRQGKDIERFKWVFVQ